jgi:hypothetical protein
MNKTIWALLGLYIAASIITVIFLILRSPFVVLSFIATIIFCYLCVFIKGEK